MSTLMLLIAAYGTTSKLPFKVVAQDIFLTTPETLDRRLKAGRIDPLGESPTILKREGIPITWVAERIDARRELANDQMRRWRRDYCEA